MMKKITLLLCVALISCFSAMAQHTFPVITGPTNVTQGSPVTLNINDAANSAAVPSGNYATFSISIDWVSTDNAWASECDLDLTTAAGTVNFNLPSTGSANSGAATTITFDGSFTADYDPDADGTFDIVLDQTYSGSAGDWSNITVTIVPALTCTSPVATAVVGTTDCAAGTYMIDVDVTNLGDATSVTIANDAGVSSTPATATGMVSVGPFTPGTDVNITIEHDQDSLCNLELSTLSYNCPPSNDECTSAIPLTVNADLDCMNVTSGTIAAATASGIATACGGTEDDDVWYSFMATSTTHVIDLQNITGGTTDLYHAVYDATSGCEALGTALTCSDPNTSTTSGLTVGTTYFVQVYSWTGTAGQTSNFDICIGTPPPPPANDTCEGAIELTLSSDDSCDNSVSGTTNSALPSASGTCSSTNKDVWYTFTPTEDNNYVFSATETFDSGFSTTYLSLYSGDCETTTQVGTTCFTTAAQTFTLTGGTTYFVNVRSTSGTAYVDFDLCVFLAPPPPANNACEDAITINAGDSISGDTTYATNVENLTVCEGGTVGTTCDPGGDSTPNAGLLVFGTGVWYVYNSPGNESISIEDSAGAFDSEIQVWSGACGSLVCVAGDDDSSNTGSGGFVCFDSEATATTYYIYIDGNAATGVGAYTLNLNTTPLPPANDECAAAEALTLGVEITGDNTGATDSGVAADCFTGAVADLWYSFVAPPSGEVTVTTTAAQYGVYTDCAGTLVGACNSSIVGGLTDGTTYYVRVSDDGTARAQAPGSFTLLLSESALSTVEFNTEALFSYYPNPVNDNLTLKAQKEISNVSVYNMLGQEVYRNAPNSVDNLVNMSDLQSGAYFVKVTIGDVTETIKVIKK
ncbi:T9SS type A sorting domain-containing protein [Olleya sp. Ti.3.14]|uniref:T9SS type A sorting domain-containing protein n=1 Tax=Olleya sp. Ti.3.14 TaxID=3121297 RepID=UPI00311D3AA3